MISMRLEFFTLPRGLREGNYLDVLRVEVEDGGGRRTSEPAASFARVRSTRRLRVIALLLVSEPVHDYRRAPRSTLVTSPRS